MIILNKIDKTYKRDCEKIRALKGVSLEISHSEFLTIIGASGSGKSTLLNIIGGLDLPDEGEVIIEGRSLKEMSDNELTLFRRRRIGHIFQFFNIFPHLNVFENVALPLLLDGKSLNKIRGIVEEMVDAVGLTKRALHLPQALSGGEMQRVAIARALIIEPDILLADEPFGNLDSKMGEEILNLINYLSHKYNQTVIMASHDLQVTKRADRVVRLKDGLLVDP